MAYWSLKDIPVVGGAAMRKKWSCGAAAMVFAFLVASGAAAQGPQGVGSEKSAQKGASSHSYNPIKWVKKDSKTTAQKPKKIKNRKGQPKNVFARSN
jgi:hypothetical protein